MSEVRACLAGCQRIARVRGLCSSCYTLTNGRIRRGETTEIAEINAGRLLHKQRHRPQYHFGRER